MFNILMSILLGCAGVCLTYYFLEVFGKPPEDPETKPPEEYLSELPEETHRKLWASIK